MRLFIYSIKLVSWTVFFAVKHSLFSEAENMKGCKYAINDCLVAKAMHVTSSQQYGSGVVIGVFN